MASPASALPCHQGYKIVQLYVVVDRKVYLIDIFEKQLIPALQQLLISHSNEKERCVIKVPDENRHWTAGG